MRSSWGIQGIHARHFRGIQEGFRPGPPRPCITPFFWDSALLLHCYGGIVTALLLNEFVWLMELCSFISLFSIENWLSIQIKWIQSFVQDSCRQLIPKFHSEFRSTDSKVPFRVQINWFQSFVSNLYQLNPKFRFEFVSTESKVSFRICINWIQGFVSNLHRRISKFRSEFRSTDSKMSFRV